MNVFGQRQILVDNRYEICEIICYEKDYAMCWHKDFGTFIAKEFCGQLKRMNIDEIWDNLTK